MSKKAAQAAAWGFVPVPGWELGRVEPCFFLSSRDHGASGSLLFVFAYEGGYRRTMYLMLPRNGGARLTDIGNMPSLGFGNRLEVKWQAPLKERLTPAIVDLNRELALFSQSPGCQFTNGWPVTTSARD